MKNKNLIFGIFLLGIVLMSSFAFAGITGYAITLSKAPVLDDNLGEASVTDVSRTGVATVEVTNPQTGTAETLFGRPGQTLTTSSGVQFTVQSATPGSLFRRPSAEISVVPVEVASPVAGIATGTGTQDVARTSKKSHFHVTNPQLFKVTFSVKENPGDPQNTYLDNFGGYINSYGYDSLLGQNTLISTTINPQDSIQAFISDVVIDGKNKKVLKVIAGCDGLLISGGYEFLDNNLKDKINVFEDRLGSGGYSYEVSSIIPDIEWINISLTYTCVGVEEASWQSTAHFPY